MNRNYTRRTLLGSAAMAAGLHLTHSSVMANALTDQIVSLAKTRMGQKVGDGQCTDFVAWVLQQAHCKAPDFSKDPYYTWGTPWHMTGKPRNPLPPLASGAQRPSCAYFNLSPGAIVQFVDCHFAWKSGNNSYTQNMPKHTAIVESVSNIYTVTFIGQNNNGVLKVGETVVDTSSLQSGSFSVFSARLA